MGDKHQIIEEPCEVKVSCTVLKTNGVGDNLVEFNTTGERIGYERGKEEGQQEQAQTLVLRQLQKRVGELPQQVREQIQGLSLEQLETLGEALLDFSALA